MQILYDPFKTPKQAFKEEWMVFSVQLGWCLKHALYLGRFENGFFEDEEDETDGEDFRIKKWDEDYEDNPYDILRVMLNYVDNDAGTALHLATKVSYKATQALQSCMVFLHQMSAIYIMYNIQNIL